MTDGASGNTGPTARRSVPVAVGLGSDRGGRARHLARGVQGLSALLGGLRCSRVYETEPVGVEHHGGEDTPVSFLNLCCTGRSAAPPSRLLEAFLELERREGRDRSRGPARTLDIDLLLYGESILDEPGLEVPHPRMTERAFVLVPLSEIAGDWRHPVAGRSIGELAEEVDGGGVEPYRGPLPSALEECRGDR